MELISLIKGGAYYGNIFNLYDRSIRTNSNWQKYKI